MDNSELSTIILNEIKEKSPDDLEKLVEEIQIKHGVPKKQIIEVVNSLIEGKEIDLQLPTLRNQSFTQFLLTVNATWFWLEIALSIISVALILSLNDNTSPLILIRNILGFVFSLFLPGYGFIKAILPYREFSQLERTLLSIGSSIALVPFVGLFLNFFNLLTITPILLSIFLLTIGFSIIGISREFRQNTGY